MDTNSRSRASHEDESTEVGSTLVAERASGVDQGTNTIGLDTSTDKRATPRCGGGGGLLGLEELLARVGALSSVICLAEERCKHGQGGSMREHSAERDG